MHVLGCLNLNESSQDAHGRAGVSRRNKGLNWNSLIKNCKSIDDNVKAMEDMLLKKPKLHFFGHKLSRLFGNEEQSVIRSYISSKEKV